MKRRDKKIPELKPTVLKIDRSDLVALYNKDGTVKQSIGVISDYIKESISGQDSYTISAELDGNLLKFNSNNKGDNFYNVDLSGLPDKYLQDVTYDNVSESIVFKIAEGDDLIFDLTPILSEYQFWERSEGEGSLIPKGSNNIASGIGSTSFGINNKSIGDYSHSEGGFDEEDIGNTSEGLASHSEGSNNIAKGISSHVEGSSNISLGNNSHAEGFGTESNGNNSHAEGKNTQSIGQNSHAEGNSTKSIGQASHAEGFQTESIGQYSHAEGRGSKSEGEGSHAEGRNTLSFGRFSHVEGTGGVSTGLDSHAEGTNSESFGVSSHAEGNGTLSSGNNSHAEGNSTTSEGESSHAEGFRSLTKGRYSHAEGRLTESVGQSSHAEGDNTKSIGDNSHAGGLNSTVESQNGFIHSNGSTLEPTAIDSVLLGGKNMVGTQKNTVYVPTLNINDVLNNPSINNLGIDIDGNVVVGTSGGGGTEYEFYEEGRCEVDPKDIAIIKSNIEDIRKNISEKEALESELKSEITFISDQIDDQTSLCSSIDPQDVNGISDCQIKLSNLIAELDKLNEEIRTIKIEKSGLESEVTFLTTILEQLEANLCYFVRIGDLNGEFNNTMIRVNTSTDEIQLQARKFVFNNNDGNEGTFLFDDLSANRGYRFQDKSGTIAHLDDIPDYDELWERSNLGLIPKGSNNIAGGEGSMAIGSGTLASGPYSHAEGNRTIASGKYSHTEGEETIASGDNSHTEGFITRAIGNNSHAGGADSIVEAENGFIHSVKSRLTSNATNSVLLGGAGLEGTEPDTVYVPKLNINELVNNPSVNNLGIDKEGNVVIGVSGGTEYEFYEEGRREVTETEIEEINQIIEKRSNELAESLEERAVLQEDILSIEQEIDEQTSLCSSIDPQNVNDISDCQIELSNLINQLDKLKESFESINLTITNLDSEIEFNVIIKKQLVDRLSYFVRIGDLNGEFNNTMIRVNTSFDEIQLQAGKFILNNNRGNEGTFLFDELTNNQDYKFQDKSGTIAHLDDIPDYGELWEISNGLNSLIPKGSNNIAGGEGSISTGRDSLASGDYSYTKGVRTTATGGGSSAEGIDTTSSGDASHTEGFRTIASGEVSHAEGFLSKSIGDYSHAEGQGTTASGRASHAEGLSSTASGEASHVEGEENRAKGDYSHAGGVASTVESENGFIHSRSSILTSGATNSVLIGGNSLIGTEPNTVYVPKLNINDVLNNPSINNLGIDIDGNVVVGTSGGDSLWETSTRPNSLIPKDSNNIASGEGSIATGNGTEASGNYSRSEGRDTISSGDYSHAEGQYTIASGGDSHAEGNRTIAIGIGSHAEGRSTQSIGFASHAEGLDSITEATAIASHAEGSNTITIGSSSHSEGSRTIANGNNSHAGGVGNTAQSYGERVIGTYSTNYTPNSTSAFNELDRAFVVGIGDDIDRKDGFITNKDGTSLLPSQTIQQFNDNSDGKIIVTKEALEDAISQGGGGGELVKVDQGNGFGYILKDRDESEYVNVGLGAIDLSFSDEGDGPIFGASGENSFASGYGTKSVGDYSHAEGYFTQATDFSAHAEGFNTLASGQVSHSEGQNTLASGDGSHAEGYKTQAIGKYSHAEGYGNDFGQDGPIALADGSHAEGFNTRAEGFSSHAQNTQTIAKGQSTHAGGVGTIANAQGETVIGMYNTVDIDFDPNDFEINDRIFTVGIGPRETERKDALLIGKNGISKLPSQTIQQYNNNSDGKIIVTKEVLEDKLSGSTGGTSLWETSVGVDSLIPKGSDCRADGDDSIAVGFKTISTGPYSFAIGLGSESIGEGSCAQGEDTISRGKGSFASGLESQANGDSSSALGDNVISNSYSETVVGVYNTVDPTSNPSVPSPTDRAFTVGVGLSFNNERDGLIVRKNGIVTAPTQTPQQYTDNSDGKILVTKEVLENKISNTKGYKELVLLVNQLEQNAPDIVILSNENNYSLINIKRLGVGLYEFELEGNPLPNNPDRSPSSPQCYQDKVTFQCFNGQTAPNLRLGMDDSIVTIASFNDAISGFQDGGIFNAMIEIRVYD